MVTTAGYFLLRTSTSTWVPAVCSPFLMYPIATGFFSDASIFLRTHNLPVVLFGPGESSEAHKPNEALVLARYYEAVACYRQLLLEQ